MPSSVSRPEHTEIAVVIATAEDVGPTVEDVATTTSAAAGRGQTHKDTQARTTYYYASRGSISRMESAQLLRGVLDLAVLAVLSEDDGYGYDIVRRMRAAGLSDVGDASVYGTLRRLYAAGALTSYVVPSEAGPHRKYYGIATAGRHELKRQHEEWTRFVDALNRILDVRPHTARETR